jgi:hypothetical protein
MSDNDPYVRAFVKFVLVGDLHARRKLSALPNELEVKLAIGLKLSILAIQVWKCKNKILFSFCSRNSTLGSS